MRVKRQKRLKSHTLFTDDTLLFCMDNVDQLKYWKWIITCFELMLSLKINIQNIEIIPMKEMEDVDRETSFFGCKVRKLPTSYLGLLLRTPHKHCGVWNSIEEGFKRKLAI